MSTSERVLTVAQIPTLELRGQTAVCVLDAQARRDPHQSRESLERKVEDPVQLVGVHEFCSTLGPHMSGWVCVCVYIYIYRYVYNYMHVCMHIEIDR